MAVVVEQWDSRESTLGESPTVDLKFYVRGTDDDLVAKYALAAHSPATYDGLKRDSLQIERVAERMWSGTVKYVKPDKPDENDPDPTSYQFDTGGGTQHITQSLATVGRYAPPGKTAPDFKGAIGVTHDSVEGVDITVPVYNFSETVYLSSDEVDGDYKAKLFRLTGKTNDGAWRGFEAGEVLFLGAAGSKKGSDDWEISFKFAASPNVVNLTVGNIAGIDKKGWEYLWVRYADEEDSYAKVLVKAPQAAYVEKVYEEADFGDLGLED